MVISSMQTLKAFKNGRLVDTNLGLGVHFIRKGQARVEEIVLYICRITTTHLKGHHHIIKFAQQKRLANMKRI